MTRILLHYLLPLILPTLAFLAWAWFARDNQAKNGKTWYKDGPWFWLISTGFALMVVGLVATALTTGSEAGKEYHAPRWEGDRVVPGRFE